MPRCLNNIHLLHKKKKKYPFCFCLIFLRKSRSNINDNCIIFFIKNRNLTRCTIYFFLLIIIYFYRKVQIVVSVINNKAKKDFALHFLCFVPPKMIIININKIGFKNNRGLPFVRLNSDLQ